MPLCKLAPTADIKKNVLFRFSFSVNEAQVLVVMVLSGIMLYADELVCNCHDLV